MFSSLPKCSQSRLGTDVPNETLWLLRERAGGPVKNRKSQTCATFASCCPDVVVVPVLDTRGQSQTVPRAQGTTDLPL